MGNSSITVEAGSFGHSNLSQNMKAGFPGFSCCKFCKHSVACTKNMVCWQGLFSLKTMLKLKEIGIKRT